MRDMREALGFTKERTEFPSKVHELIHICALRLTPPEVSLAKLEDGPMKRGCEQYYAFIVRMLADMYECPEAYGMPVYALERHLNGKKLNGVQRKQPSKTKDIRAATGASVASYYRLLYMLAAVGEAREGALFVPLSAYLDVRKRFDTALSKGKTNDNRVPYEARVAALARAGLMFEQRSEGLTLTCPDAPQMFIAMSALAASADSVKVFGEMNVANLEYRQIFECHSPDYEDVVRTLDERKRAAADAVHAHALSRRMVALCETYWKVNYKYKGAQTLCIDTNGNRVEFRVTCAYGWDDREAFDALLLREDPQTQRCLHRHLNYCTGCSTTHLGAFATVMGKRRRVCGGGGIGFRFADPDEYELGVICRLMDLRARFVDAAKAAAKQESRAARG